MRAQIYYPADLNDGLENSLNPVQMHIKLFPEPDFKGGNDGKSLDQLLAKIDTNGDVIEIVVRDNKGREKFKLPARAAFVSTTWGTLMRL